MAALLSSSAKPVIQKSANDILRRLRSNNLQALALLNRGEQHSVLLRNLSVSSSRGTQGISALPSSESIGSSRRNKSGTGGSITAETSAPAAALETEGESSSSNIDDSAVVPSKAKSYSDLAKAKLSALVVTTTAAGFVAAGGPLSEQAALAACCVVGTALCSSSAAAWNQIFEIDRDAKMKRTQQRPLVKGHLTVREASLAATAWGVGGTSLLYLGTDPITTLLGLGNIGLYAGLYTYMKPRSIYNTWVGAVVGAIPPVMGWTAATGGNLMDLDAILLGTTLYLWQMPHFFALSFMHRVDYKRGGFAMLPVLESDGERTAQVILRYAAYLSTVPFVATMTGVTSSMFALEGVALNSYALYVAYKFRQERTNANARKVFLTSLWYLPSWLVLFLLHSKVWDEDRDQDVLRDGIADMIHSIRNQGKQICIHEQVIAQNKNQLLEEGERMGLATGQQDSKCPVTSLARKTTNLTNAASSVVVAAELHQNMNRKT